MANGRRKRNLSLHYSVIAFIVLIIFAILSMTVFFNIETAVIMGSSIYSAEEITEAGGIHGGDNMVRKNMSKAEEAIVSKLTYIETAEIKRKLPSSVEIFVTPCVETASLEDEDGFMIVSGMGKILRFTEEPAENTRIFYGAEPAEGLEIGMNFASADEKKTEVISELMSRGDSGFVSKVTSFDVSDRLNISCVYDNRIDVELGVISEIDYKFRLANEILTTRISPDSEGRLKMLEAGAQYLSKSDLEQIEQTFEYNSEMQSVTSVSETESGGTGETSGTEDTSGTEVTSVTEMSTKLNFE